MTEEGKKDEGFSSQVSAPKTGLTAFWQELTCPAQLIERRGKRRKVMRVAISHVISW